MRIYPRRKKNGERVWWASWTENGITLRRSTRCSTKAAAELVVARWERERADPVYAAANAATFGEEVRLFLASCKDAVARHRMAPGTLGMYRQKAATLVHFLGAELRLGLIDASTFATYLEQRRAHGLRDEDGVKVKDIAEGTLYKEWVTFRGVLKSAWRAQRFGRDPASLKPEHFGPEYEPCTTFLTAKQADALLLQLSGDRRRMVAFVLATGARRREAYLAQSGDIGGGVVHLRGTKTKGSLRTIPIPKPMRRWAKIAGQPPFAPWPNARRGLAAACLRAGVPAVTWNDLRRTFASLLIQAGVAPHVVARLLGHSTTAMVDRVYGRTGHEDLARLLDSQLGRGAKGRTTSEPT
jgi:hypothetical protein